MKITWLSSCDVDIVKVESLGSQEGKQSLKWFEDQV